MHLEKVQRGMKRFKLLLCKSQMWNILERFIVYYQIPLLLFAYIQVREICLCAMETRTFFTSVLLFGHYLNVLYFTHNILLIWLLQYLWSLVAKELLIIAIELICLRSSDTSTVSIVVSLCTKCTTYSSNQLIYKSLKHYY